MFIALSLFRSAFGFQLVLDGDPPVLSNASLSSVRSDVSTVPSSFMSPRILILIVPSMKMLLSVLSSSVTVLASALIV